LERLLSSKLILIGYALIAGFLLLSIQVFKSNDAELNQHYQKFLVSQKQVHLIHQMQLHAKNRSILLSQALIDEDPFKQDEYIQQLLIEGENFSRTRTILLQSGLSLQQKQAIDNQYDNIQNNGERQNTAAELILDGKHNEAKELLHKTVPIQTEILKNLLIIAKDLYRSSKTVEKEYQEVLEKDEYYSSLLHVSLLVSILILALYSYRLARQIENKQQNEVLVLAEEVDNQTYVNALDAHILHAVDEYILLVDLNGQFIRMNPSLEKLIEHPLLNKVTNIWALLQQSSHEKISKKIITQQILENGAWKQELELNKPFNCYSLCEISPFQSSEIKKASYLLVIKDITELKQTQKAVEIQANYDAVTELPNRHFFQKTLSDYTENQNQALAVLYIDLDDFKNVNDSLGHHYGDQLLNFVSERMQTVLFEFYFNHFHLARIGGDEFAIILMLEATNLKAESQTLANLIIKTVSEPYSISNNTIEIGCSIGIALFPEQADNAVKLMRHADLAMYHAKHSGKQRCILFNSSIEKDLEQKIILKNRIETALADNEFIMYFQPQYNLKTKEIIGLEALIRWNSSEACYRPDEFIPFAEQNGLIHLIDSYVVKMVCKQIADWQKQKIQVPRVAINISSQQINSNNLLKLLDNEIVNHNLTGKNLELEITEYSLVESLKKEGKQDSWLQYLHQKGIHISIDDFGTGYSSLSYLQHMNINRLKIDRSFIQEITHEKESQSIVSSIIALGHNVNATVLAEGIETEEQRQLLIALSCDEGQGYLMNKPLPPEDITKILTS